MILKGKSRKMILNVNLKLFQNLNSNSRFFSTKINARKNTSLEIFFRKLKNSTMKKTE
jgi:hypothetical protein